jgi:hypothetical protein
MIYRTWIVKGPPKDSVTVSRMFTGQDDKGPLQDEVRDTSRIEAQRIHFRTKSGTPLG